MSNTTNIFFSVANRVSNSTILQQIIQKQQNVFDIQPYKVDGCWG